MSAHALAARRGNPAPWRRTVRATWLQHRGLLSTTTVVFAVVAALIVWSGLRPHALAAGCPNGSGAICLSAQSALAAHSAALARCSIALLALPVLTGVFVGAPVIARELETGSFRFAWTEGMGRTRLLLAKLALLGAACAAAAAVLGVLAGWLADPFEQAGLASNWQYGQFDATYLALPAWTLCCLAIGAFAGMAIGRVVPAMAVTAAVTGSLMLLDVAGLHDSFLLGIHPVVTRAAPAVGSAPGHLNTFAVPGSYAPAGSWLVQAWYTTANGWRLSAQAATSLVGKLDVSRQLISPGYEMRWLARHHASYWLSYQPAGRFWVLQGAQAAVLLVAALLLAAGTIQLARRHG
jgi:hypothetical protein